MDELNMISDALSKLRIGKMEDIVFDSENPLSDILYFFQKDSKSFEIIKEHEIKSTVFIMDKSFFGKPLEVVTVKEINGEFLSVSIYGNNTKTSKEYNKLVNIYICLDEQSEGYLGELGKNNGITYFGNLFSNYIFGISKDTKIIGDTLQVFSKNIFKHI